MIRYFVAAYKLNETQWTQRNATDNSMELITQWNSMDNNIHGLARPLVLNQTHLAHDMDGSAIRPTSRQLSMVGG